MRALGTLALARTQAPNRSQANRLGSRTDPTMAKLLECASPLALFDGAGHSDSAMPRCSSREPAERKRQRTAAPHDAGAIHKRPRRVHGLNSRPKLRDVSYP